MEEKVQRLLKWASGGTAPPYQIELAVTRSCNLRCIFCSQRLPENCFEKVVPEEKLIQIVQEAAKMRVREISIAGGGEPLCRPKTTFRIMKIAKSYDMAGGITTNGTLFTEGMIKKLVEIEWNCIIFSIDSPSAIDHNFLRCDKNAFQKSINAMKHFQYWKNKLKKIKPVIHINTVLCNVNYDKMNQMIELAHELGVSHITLIPLLINTPESEKLKLSDEQIVEFQEHIKHAKSIADKYHLTTNLNDFVDPRLISKTTQMDDVILSDIENDSSDKNGFAALPCFYPWLSLVIHSSGHINPCIYEKPISYIGERHLNEVWYSDEYLNYIRKQMIERKLPKMCSTCCAPRVAENRELRKELNNRIVKEMQNKKVKK